MDPTSAAFLEFDRQPTGILDAEGKDITNGLAVIKALRIRGMKSDRASETYLRVKSEAEERERAIRLKLGTEAMDHIMRYGDAFLAAEAAGTKPPKRYERPPSRPKTA